MKYRKFYIPKLGRVCLEHSVHDNWPENIDPNNLPFTVEHIEEMIDLLCLEPTDNRFDMAGMIDLEKNINKMYAHTMSFVSL